MSKALEDVARLAMTAQYWQSVARTFVDVPHAPAIHADGMLLPGEKRYQPVGFLLASLLRS